MIERKYRYHDDPYDKSNWCEECGLYYCWHPECGGHRNDSRAHHKFIPTKKEFEEIYDDYFEDE